MREMKFEGPDAAKQQQQQQQRPKTAGPGAAPSSSASAPADKGGKMAYSQSQNNLPPVAGGGDPGAQRLNRTTGSSGNDVPRRGQQAGGGAKSSSSNPSSPRGGGGGGGQRMAQSFGAPSPVPLSPPKAIDWSLVPLPDLWECRRDPKTGKNYYVDHRAKRTTWKHPLQEEREALERQQSRPTVRVATGGRQARADSATAADDEDAYDV
jgi:hypothetical protein